jgi:hypothetical protein
MTQLLRLLPAGPLWPYSVRQFRRDEPWLSISDAPHDAELASYGELDPPILVRRVIHVEPPEYDSTTHYVEEVMPTEIDGVWLQTWQLQPLPPVPPQPDYRGFYDALLVSGTYNAALQQVMSAPSPGPAAALAVLISALQDALNGRPNPPALQSAIWLLLGQLALPPEAAAELQGLLDAANLAELYSLIPPSQP